MSKISVYKFADGYYAVGYEGRKKAFVPSIKLVALLLKEEGKVMKLTSNDIRFKQINNTLNEHLQWRNL